MYYSVLQNCIRDMKKLFLPVLPLFYGLGWVQPANDCFNVIVVCGNSVVISSVAGFESIGTRQ